MKNMIRTNIRIYSDQKNDTNEYTNIFVSKKGYKYDTNEYSWQKIFEYIRISEYSSHYGINSSLNFPRPSFVKNTVNAKTKRIGSSIICIPIMCIFVLPVVFGLTYYVIILYCWFIGATPYQTFSMIDPKYLDYDVII